MTYAYFWDIETSKVKCDNGEFMQVTYLSNLLIMDYVTGKIIDSIFHRTLEEFINYIMSIEDEIIIWSHNLDYELTFLLREIGECNGQLKVHKGGNVVGIYSENMQDIILRDKHSPLQIKLDILPNITFRDTYAIFNKSVAMLGEDIGLPKLEYDYSKVRLPWNELTDLDYEYNERDNVIVAKNLFLYMQNNYMKYEDIPLTFTSFVKRKRKEFIIENYGKKAIQRFLFDRNKQYKDFHFFELLLHVFQGGLTTSNINETGKLIDNGVYSVDIKSSYPFQMCTRFFPYFLDECTESFYNTFANNFYKHGDYKGFVGMFRFKNLRVKNRNYLLPISTSLILKGTISNDKVLFNGKLLSASDLFIPCTNVDIDTINLVYNYDEIICEELHVTTKQRRLRQEEISFLLDGFTKKETLTKDTYDYHLAKVVINANYGIKVTAPIKSSFNILDGEIQEIDYMNFNVDDREMIYETFINSQNAFTGTLDIYSDGVFITSYARFMLVEMMVKLVDMGCNVIYSDTDSIKFYMNKASENDVFDFINKVNFKTFKGNKRNKRFTNYKDQFNISQKVMDKICKLGMWEMETVDKYNNPSPIQFFKTFGAKKYGYIKDNKVYTTIAGCNKFYPSQVIHAISEKHKISLKESFDLVFAMGTQFDESASGRKVATMEKRTREEMDLLTYKGRKIGQYGGIILEETTYTLNITLNDSKILNVGSVKDVIIIVSRNGDVRFND